MRGILNVFNVKKCTLHIQDYGDIQKRANHPLKKRKTM